MAVCAKAHTFYATTCSEPTNKTTQDIVVTCKNNDSYYVSERGPCSLSPREAAIGILSEIDWCSILDDYYFFRDADPLLVRGLMSELSEIKWDGEEIWYAPRLGSHLKAWATARMVRRFHCIGHEGYRDIYEDTIPFGDCYYDDEEQGPHEWDNIWTLEGNLGEFIEIACYLIRDGWPY